MSSSQYTNTGRVAHSFPRSSWSYDDSVRFRTQYDGGLAWRQVNRGDARRTFDVTTANQRRQVGGQHTSTKLLADAPAFTDAERHRGRSTGVTERRLLQASAVVRTGHDDDAVTVSSSVGWSRGGCRRSIAVRRFLHEPVRNELVGILPPLTVAADGVEIDENERVGTHVVACEIVNIRQQRYVRDIIGVQDSIVLYQSRGTLSVNLTWYCRQSNGISRIA